MNSKEAKFLLNAYRPSGADAADPTLAEALRQAQADPALAQWLERSRAHDAAVAGKLGEIAPPPGLRDAILAGARVSEPSPAWRRSAWLTLAGAAAAVLVLVLGVWPMKVRADERKLAAFAAADTRDEEHGGHGEPMHELQKWLGQAPNHATKGMPMDFATLRATGCRRLEFNGRELLELCFRRDGKWFHLYVARAADFPMFPAQTKPMITEQGGGVACASWSDAANRCHCVVVSPAGADAVRQLL